MKNFFIVMILSLLVFGCVERNTVATVSAHDGAPGHNGSNGHSIVSLIQSADEEECDVSGSRIDMYVDTDDSLTATEGDVYVNSLIVCNGANGLNGTNGLDGTNGTDGKDGAQGPQGEVGPQGEQGPAGIGIQGPVGPVGPQGPQGIPGSPGSSATITVYSSSSCTLITGTTTYVKPTGSGNFGLYTTSTCSSSSKTAEVAQGESYWVSTKSLAVWASDQLRVITYN